LPANEELSVALNEYAVIVFSLLSSGSSGHPVSRKKQNKPHTIEKITHRIFIVPPETF
jgi:hypothetical protein